MRGPICHERDGCAARDEVSNRELSDLASADHNDLAPPQIAEDLLRQRGRCGRDRRGALPDRSLRARLLAGVERLAEEPIEDRPGRPRRVRRAHLAEDLTLAGHERIETRGHAKEVARRVFVAEPVQGGAELGLESEECRFRFFLGALG